MTCFQFRRQLWAIAGYFLPHSPSSNSAQSALAVSVIHGAVDLLHRCRYRSSVLEGDEIETVADEMDDTGLNGSLWK